ncbi:hypothetical protein ACIBG5_10985 [Kribbella sp. NPDC050241]|uniref:hypothetical protein n=1 Tax=Kribbella sp. NPDC050241 TaxID=3364115 RepID=UPI003799E771
MGVVERAAIAGLHAEVVNAWKGIVSEASTLGLADRIVISVKLKARADALAAYEGLVRDAGDLATDVRAFATAVKMQNPLTGVVWGTGLASGVLGFFGWWSFVALRTAWSDTEGGMAQTTAAVIGVLTVASGVVIVAVVRAAVIAAQAALQTLDDFSAKEHPSAELLREVRPAEERLFAVFRQRVPEPPITAGPLIVLGVVGLLAGVLFAAMTGVGAPSA